MFQKKIKSTEPFSHFKSTAPASEWMGKLFPCSVKPPPRDSTSQVGIL